MRPLSRVRALAAAGALAASAHIAAPAHAAVLALAVNTVAQTLRGPGATPVDLRTPAAMQNILTLTTPAKRTLLVTFQAACRVVATITVAGATIEVSVNGGPFVPVVPTGSFASFCIQNYIGPEDYAVNSLSGVVAVPAGTIRFRANIDVYTADDPTPFILLDDTLLVVVG